MVEGPPAVAAVAGVIRQLAEEDDEPLPTLLGRDAVPACPLGEETGAIAEVVEAVRPAERAKGKGRKYLFPVGRVALPPETGR